MVKKLHIVAFDIPDPPNYGGVIDVFYKIKALHEVGVIITLHVFRYGGREVTDELRSMCRGGVHVYERRKGLSTLLSSLPFIVASRMSRRLLTNLCADESPILFEGLHCCGFIGDRRLEGRSLFVRMHNIEHKYYENLANSERKFWKRMFFKAESRKLKAFEPSLEKAKRIFTISNTDQEYYRGIFETSQRVYPFHGYSIQEADGDSDYVIYHGKLSVAENIEAVEFLLDQIAANLNVRLIIAGQQASPTLRDRIENAKGVELVSDPSNEQMNQLMSGAMAHILPGFRVSGVKLKMLAALHSGRPVLTTPEMVEGTKLGDLCQVAHTPCEWMDFVEVLSKGRFRVDYQKRKELLAPFSNSHNADKIWAAISAS